jgi:hypothetical protein
VQLRIGRFAGGPGIREVKLGAELCGGLGDSDLGLTLDPKLTEQYAGLNVRTELENGLHAQIGTARTMCAPVQEVRRTPRASSPANFPDRPLP